ncbi:hypothetical protein FISHEDRAFT_49643 [Fistulina hepatica ATCC 64428]|uniref:Uncharacterized protein n=1 Tax=Fistulina hepatica ATCC 64428 TaxID=1128425 RepID=A0A0D7A3A6_9AGAR|nr:hypothetical protein FISHEDRAFT_49643 [Fistulina hepatica ATCC 64428]
MGIFFLQTAPLAQNSVWTTVGPNGKMTAPASTRPVSSGASSGPAAVRPNGVSATRPAAVPAVKPAPAPRPEDMMPSTEFLKWLGEALKGLNGSANVEDLITMLLSFQVEDIDASTMELIQDLIYMNSTTMDGRRFATEFVSHRKADLASKSRVPGVSGAKFSIADIVKAQPKSTQPEWGGFKVVNKKRKGGKA